MRYLGLLLDNDKLHEALQEIKSDSFEIVEEMSNLRHASQYKSEGGQNRGREIEELIKELEHTVEKHKAYLAIDLDALKLGSGDFGIADASSRNKVSALNNDYLDRVVHFSRDYQLGKGEDGFGRDLRAVFYDENTSVGAIRLHVVKPAQLLAPEAGSSLAGFLRNVGVTREAYDQFIEQFDEDMEHLIAHTFSASSTATLRQEAETALERRTPKPHSAEDLRKPQVWFSFYNGGGKKNAGCIVSNEFNFVRGEKHLGTDLSDLGKRSAFMSKLCIAMNISNEEAKAFDAGIVERIPVAPQKSSTRELAAKKAQMLTPPSV